MLMRTDDRHSRIAGGSSGGESGGNTTSSTINTSNTGASSRYAIADPFAHDIRDVPPRATAQDLPLYLRICLALHPGNSKGGMALNILISPIGCIAPTLVMGYMLKSAALGVVFGSCLCVTSIIWVLSAPRIEGVLWELVLEDPQELNKKLKAACLAQLLFGNVIFMPTIFYFAVLPCVDSDLFGGQNTKPYLLSWFLLAWFMNIFQPTIQSLMQLPAQTKKIWSEKIRNYFETLSRIIVNGTDKTDVESGVKQTIREIISKEQKAVESWSRKVNKATQGLNTSGILVPFSMALTALVMLTYLPDDASYSDRVIAITVNVLFIFMLSVFFVVSLYGVAEPNLSFERYKAEILSDYRIIDANLKRGWTPDHFHNWLNSHSLSAGKAFGTKITAVRMRSVATAVTTTLGILLYFLLREDIQGMLT